MSYQALYRVWRPQNFIDVVGQEHITKTLQNALLQQKTSHAYLFSGPRGTGKTSAAKILAKAINCERSPVKEPCNQCAACIGITDGSISDVIEIDAASNNGVEEIRDIRDKVKYAPSVVKYKVYIVDEVHMLSIGAFNALLKTLEEPPQHVMFILATTEPHKIPLTIISRCQRFDFRRITANDIVRRMQAIAEETQLSYDEKALQLIARAAEGGMRDALSLLDQAISFSDEKVTVEDALMVTGSVSQGLLIKMAEAILRKNISSGLQHLEELLYQGKDPSRFIEDFIMFFRDMLLNKAAPQLEESLERVLLDEDFLQLSKEYSLELIYHIMEELNKTQQEIKWTNQSRVFLEVVMVKLCQSEVYQHQSPSYLNNDHLITRIEQLESELQKLKNSGITYDSPSAENEITKKRTQRPARPQYKVPIGKINEVLKNATKQDLQSLKSCWGNMLQMLSQQNMRSQAALLNDAEPVAASINTFVIKFKYEIHCKMAMENSRFLDTVASILQQTLGKRMEMLGIPEDQWGDIRENYLNQQQNQEIYQPNQEENPIITEAQELVGLDLLEIND